MVSKIVILIQLLIMCLRAAISPALYGQEQQSPLYPGSSV
jgi:hypothetical protein